MKRSDPQNEKTFEEILKQIETSELSPENKEILKSEVVKIVTEPNLIVDLSAIRNRLSNVAEPFDESRNPKTRKVIKNISAICYEHNQQKIYPDDTKRSNVKSSSLEDKFHQVLMLADKSKTVKLSHDDVQLVGSQREKNILESLLDKILDSPGSGDLCDKLFEALEVVMSGGKVEISKLMPLLTTTMSIGEQRKSKIPLADEGSSYDLLVCLTDFTDPAQDDGRVLSKESVERFLESDEYKRLIERRLMMGLLTHKGRDVADQDRSVPYVDTIAKHPDLCNVITNTYIDGDKWMAELKLIETDACDRFYEIVKAEIYCGVSVVMYISNMEATNEPYNLLTLYGVDFTLDPAFETAVIAEAKSFQRSAGGVNGAVVLLRSKPVNLEEGLVSKSIKSYIRERSYDYATFMRNRIIEVIRHMKTMSEEGLKEHQDTIEDYVVAPLLRWCSKGLKSPDGIINIALSLRLNKWVKSPILTKYNVIANRMRRVFASTGSFNPQDIKLYLEIFDTMSNALLEEVWRLGRPVLEERNE